MRIFPGLVLVVLAGCTGDLVEINAGGGKAPDMAFSAVDMTQAGGGELGLSTAKFFPDIQMDMDAKGCTLTACHGAAGTGAPMLIKPMVTAQADIDANYMQAMIDVNLMQPDQSPLVQKPLMGSITHSGTKPFTSTSDPTYVKWLGWIAAGAPKQ
jgi:hypothetical protein